MNKIIVIGLLVAMLTGCTPVARKNLSKTLTYRDPQTIGGYWTVVDGSGNRYEHCRCVYWGTEDDTSIYEEGPKRSIICISGNVTLIKE